MPSAVTTSQDLLEESNLCLSCSLYDSSSHNMDSSFMLENFASYTLPGVIFLLLGCRWAIGLILEWTELIPDCEQIETEKSNRADFTAHSKSEFYGYRCFTSLPWEGIVKLLLTGVGILASVLTSTHSDSTYDTNIRYATMYLAFSLSGLMDILVYYCGYSVLPEGIQSLFLSFAFGIEGFLFHVSTSDNVLCQYIHFLLAATVFGCSFTSCFEVLHDNRLIKFSRTFLTILQSTWLIHSGLLVQKVTKAPNFLSVEWISILFVWHLCIVLSIFISVLLISNKASIRTSQEHWGDLKISPDIEVACQIEGNSEKNFQQTHEDRLQWEKVGVVGVTGPAHRYSTISDDQPAPPLAPRTFSVTPLSSNLSMKKPKPEMEALPQGALRVEPLSSLEQRENYIGSKPIVGSKPIEDYRPQINLKESSLI